MALTYEPIATTTLTSSASTITFSSITGSYTDLFITGKWLPTSGGNYNILMRYNSDSGNNYSATYLFADSGGSQSARSTNISGNYLISGNATGSRAPIFMCHIQDYANTTTYKSGLLRNNWSDLWTMSTTNLWRNTSAISTISFHTTNTDFEIGSYVTIYGIKAA